LQLGSFSWREINFQKPSALQKDEIPRHCLHVCLQTCGTRLCLSSSSTTSKLLKYSSYGGLTNFIDCFLMKYLMLFLFVANVFNQFDSIFTRTLHFDVIMAK